MHIHLKDVYVIKVVAKEQRHGNDKKSVTMVLHNIPIFLKFHHI